MGQRGRTATSAALRRANFVPVETPFISKIKKGWGGGHVARRWQKPVESIIFFFSFAGFNEL